MSSSFAPFIIDLSRVTSSLVTSAIANHGCPLWIMAGFIATLRLMSSTLFSLRALSSHFAGHSRKVLSLILNFPMVRPKNLITPWRSMDHHCSVYSLSSFHKLFNLGNLHTGLLPSRFLGCHATLVCFVGIVAWHPQKKLGRRLPAHQPDKICFALPLLSTNLVCIKFSLGKPVARLSCQWRQCRQVATDIFTDVICDKRRANFELCSQCEGRIYTNQNVFLCWSDFRKLFYYNALRVMTTLPYKEGYSQ